MTRYASKGLLLKMGDGAATEVFTTIGQVIDVDGPNLETETKDATDQDSTDYWREHVETVLSAGEVTFNVHLDPGLGTHDQTTGLLSKVDGSGPYNFQLVFPDTGALAAAFAASVSLKPSMPFEGKITMDVTLKISGKPTFT